MNSELREIDKETPAGRPAGGQSPLQLGGLSKSRLYTLGDSRDVVVGVVAIGLLILIK